VSLRFRMEGGPWLGYLPATDGVAHFDGRDALVKAFTDVAHQVCAARDAWAESHGVVPHVVLCSDHGMEWGLHSNLSDEDIRARLRLEGFSTDRLGPRGVLLAPMGRRSDAERVRAFCADVTTVLFDCDIAGAGEAFVGSDNDQSIGLIVDHLCRTGTAPAFFEMREPANPNAIKRRNAYAAAMSRRGLEPMFIQVEGSGWDFEEIAFRGALRAIGRRALPSDTVLCSNDRLAIGFLSAAYERGWRVGRGPGCALRVAGHDDHPFARYTCPRLTTVAQDYAAIARRSAETLLDLIRGDSRATARETTLFRGRLVERASA